MAIQEIGKPSDAKCQLTSEGVNTSRGYAGSGGGKSVITESLCDSILWRLPWTFRSNYHAVVLSTYLSAIPGLRFSRKTLFFFLLLGLRLL